MQGTSIDQYPVSDIIRAASVVPMQGTSIDQYPVSDIIKLMANQIFR